MPTSIQLEKWVELFVADFGNTVAGQTIRKIAQGARKILIPRDLPRMNPDAFTEPNSLYRLLRKARLFEIYGLGRRAMGCNLDGLATMPDNSTARIHFLVTRDG